MPNKNVLQNTTDKPCRTNHILKNYFLVACSHDRAWQYFAESVINPVGFPALRCADYESFTDGTCFKDFAYSERHEIQYMGLAVNKK